MLTFALVAGLLLLGIWLLAVRHLPLQTNVLALLPATERDPVAEQAVEHLAGSVSDRVVVLIGAPDAHVARTAAARFDTLARASGAFASVQGKVPPLDPVFLSNFYRPHRFQLLSPADRADLQAQLRRNAAGDAALAPLSLSNSPFGLTDATDDPFGWLDRWLMRLPFGQLRMLPDDGWLSTRQAGKTWVLVSLQTQGSAFDSAVQRRIAQFFDTAQGQIVGVSPGVEVLRSGAVLHAAGARSQAEAELHRIGIVATLGIALLTLWAFRSGRLLAMGLATMAFGTLCAALATLVIFGELHLLTLVFGAALIGETVDYAIQYFVSPSRPACWATRFSALCRSRHCVRLPCLRWRACSRPMRSSFGPCPPFYRARCLRCARRSLPLRNAGWRSGAARLPGGAARRWGG
jgi:predicted exporter